MDDCVFCRILSGEVAASFVLKTSEVFAIVDPRQFHDGHVLVLPAEHIRDLTELPERLTGPLMSAVARVARAARAAFAPEG